MWRRRGGYRGGYTGTCTPAVEEQQYTGSEPAGRDFSNDCSTRGRIAVGGSPTGELGVWDSDWFAVELEEGKTCQVDMKGAPTGDGTLANPWLRGIHDAEGNYPPRIGNSFGPNTFGISSFPFEVASLAGLRMPVATT